MISDLNSSVLSNSTSEMEFDIRTEYVKIPRHIYEDLIQKNQKFEEQERSLKNKYFSLRKKYLTLKADKKKDENRLKILAIATKDYVSKQVGNIVRTL